MPYTDIGIAPATKSFALNLAAGSHRAEPATGQSGILY